MKLPVIALAVALLLAGCQKEEIDPQNSTTGSPGTAPAACSTTPPTT